MIKYFFFTGKGSVDKHTIAVSSVAQLVDQDYRVVLINGPGQQFAGPFLTNRHRSIATVPSQDVANFNPNTTIDYREHVIG
ncbi:hypothetical protein [Levilactobacillus fujinensis]|uniref:Uncharacterized protein n=1 Tax=Levilactobacillus fujinensis TaxID=2486024 RepID=A0ABW1TLP4_9LACO|nr:hypothetical protein [Levilactobacillus fujinensis]